jgi:hypothetical protein
MSVLGEISRGELILELIADSPNAALDDAENRLSAISGIMSHQQEQIAGFKRRLPQYVASRIHRLRKTLR